MGLSIGGGGGLLTLSVGAGLCKDSMSESHILTYEGLDLHTMILFLGWEENTIQPITGSESSFLVLPL